MPSERLRRHLRVSLKTMMVLVVILAVPLAWGVNRAREQRRAVAAVKKYGGWVHYDYEFVGGKLTPGQEPWAPRWMRSLLGDEFFQEIAYVSLVYDSTGGKRREITNFAPCDDIFAQLAGQSGIKQLLLQRTQATDRGLEHVGRMTGLEVALYLGCRVDHRRRRRPSRRAQEPAEDPHRQLSDHRSKSCSIELAAQD